MDADLKIDPDNAEYYEYAEDTNTHKHVVSCPRWYTRYHAKGYSIESLKPQGRF